MKSAGIFVHQLYHLLWLITLCHQYTLRLSHFPYWCYSEMRCLDLDCQHWWLRRVGGHSLVLHYINAKICIHGSVLWWVPRLSCCYSDTAWRTGSVSVSMLSWAAMVKLGLSAEWLWNIFQSNCITYSHEGLELKDVFCCIFVSDENSIYVPFINYLLPFYILQVWSSPTLVSTSFVL